MNRFYFIAINRFNKLKIWCYLGDYLPVPIQFGELEQIHNFIMDADTRVRHIAALKGKEGVLHHLHVSDSNRLDLDNRTVDN